LYKQENTMNTKFHNLAIFTARGHITVTVRIQEFQDGSYRCYVVRDDPDGVFEIMREFGTDTDAAITFAENYISTIDPVEAA